LQRQVASVDNKILCTAALHFMFTLLMHQPDLLLVRMSSPCLYGSNESLARKGLIIHF